MFGKVLVANRGEIARRVFRACRTLGVTSVAVFSNADRSAPHVGDADEAVPIGAAPARQSYLSIENILAAARRTRADAVTVHYDALLLKLITRGESRAQALARMADALEQCLIDQGAFHA